MDTKYNCQKTRRSRRREKQKKRRPDYAPSLASFAGVGGVKTTFTACSVSSSAPKITGEIEKDFGRILPSRRASYPCWIVRRVVRHTIRPSPEWLLYDRLEEKCCDKDGKEDTEDDDYSDLYLSKALNTCIFFH